MITVPADVLWLRGIYEWTVIEVLGRKYIKKTEGAQGDHWFELAHSDEGLTWTDADIVRLAKHHNVEIIIVSAPQQ